MLTKGHGKERLYGVWAAMKSRCYNPNNKSFRDYGERGIKVCNEWKNSYEEFRKFALNNGYDPKAPKGQCTIERIDVNGDYEPSNCTFVTRLQQGRNKRNNHVITYKGETKPISEIAEIYGKDISTLYNRINKQGLSPEEAIEKDLWEPPKYTVYHKTHTVREWAEILGVKYETLKARLCHENHDMCRIVQKYHADFFMKTFPDKEIIQKPFEVAKKYTAGKESHTRREWSEILGVKFKTLNNWLREHNFDIYKAVLKYKPSYLEGLKF